MRHEIRIGCPEQLQEKWEKYCKKMGKKWDMNQSQIGRMALKYYMEEHLD